MVLNVAGYDEECRHWWWIAVANINCSLINTDSDGIEQVRRTKSSWQIGFANFDIDYLGTKHSTVSSYCPTFHLLNAKQYTSIKAYLI